MINRVAKFKQFNVINIVRSAKSKLLLEQEEKITDVLSMEDKDFYDKLKHIAKNLNSLYCLDPIGGEVTGKTIKALPPNSSVIVYGSLSEKYIECVDGAELRMNNKAIIGFALFNWWPKLTNKEKDECKRFIVNNLDLFKTNIKKTFELDNFIEAIQEYKNDMSSGKILLKF